MSKVVGYVGAFYMSRYSALAFDGTGDKIVVSDDSTINFGATDDMTLEIWFRSSADGRLFDKDDGGSPFTGYKVSVSSNNIVFEIGDGTNTSSITGSTNVNDSIWHHLVCVRDAGSNLYIYLDGSSDATAVSDTTTGTLANGVNLGIGAVASDASNCITGRIGEVIIYKGLAMSSTNVTSRYNNSPTSGKGRMYPDLNQEGFGSFAVVHLPISEGTGTNLIDASGNGNNGTITNATWSTFTMSVTGETPSGSGKSYQTANSNIVWNSMVVYDGGTSIGKAFTVTPSGVITLDNTPSGAVTVDYDYTEVSQLGGFFGNDIDWSVDMLETTDFDDNGYRNYLAGQTSWTATANKHWVCPGVYGDLGVPLIVKFYLDKSNNRRLEGWCRISGISPTAPVDALIDEPISLQGLGTLTYLST